MWDWMQTKGGKVFEGESFKAEIIAVFLVACETLPDIGGNPYREAVEAGKAEGMGEIQAMTAAALYFAVNHGLSPTGETLDRGEAYLPLQPFMEDAAAWYSTHVDLEPVEAMRLYAEWALREKPVAVTEIEKPKNGLKSLDLQLFAEEEGIIKVNVAKLGDVFYPLDKVNSRIWSLIGNDAITCPPIRVEKRGSKKPIDITWSINFDDVEDRAVVTKRLTQYDKRVYVAVSSLHRAGNEFFTLRQIHEAMGNEGHASEKQREKISESLWKMAKAWFELDNSVEAGTYNYPRFVYKGPLLPIESVKTIVNGNLVEETIHLFREPPAARFARERNQITAFPIKLLASPVSKTELNLAIEDYLLERISHAKAGAGLARILYSSICNKANATTKKQQQRIPEKVKKYLMHYVECGFIDSFTEDANGVVVSF